MNYNAKCCSKAQNSWHQVAAWYMPLAPCIRLKTRGKYNSFCRGSPSGNCLKPSKLFGPMPSMVVTASTGRYSAIPAVVAVDRQQELVVELMKGQGQRLLGGALLRAEAP